MWLNSLRGRPYSISNFSSSNALEENNRCHPFYELYLITFYGSFWMKPKDGKDVVGEMKIDGARHCIYAIARKPH